jgi:tetratricopeptide (TPR) repeat protein
LALKDIERVAALPPQSAQSNTETQIDALRGLILCHLGRYAEAFPFLVRAHRQKPDDKGITVTLWKLSTHLRKFGTSAHLAQHMMETWPDEARAQCLHALSIAQLGSYDDALKLLDDAEARASSPRIAVHERARILAAAGRYAEASKAYEASLAARPKWPDSSLRYAFLLATCPEARVRDVEKACEHARTAAATLTGTLYEPEARIVHAMALASAGKWDSALREVDAAAKLDWTADPTRQFCRSLRELIAAGTSYIDEPMPGAPSRFTIPAGLTVDTWPPPEKEPR